MLNLRAILVTAGFPDTKSNATMNNILTAGIEVSPTARACYEAELYKSGKAFYKRHLRNIGATKVSYPSRFKLQAARQREDYLQRQKQAERDIIRESYNSRKKAPTTPKPTAITTTWDKILKG